MAMTQKEEGHTHHQREIVALLAVGAPYCPAESIVGSSTMAPLWDTVGTRNYPVAAEPVLHNNWTVKIRVTK